MFKKISTFCLFLTLFCLNTHAQSSFQKAIIIDNKNDTIEGFIKYEGWYGTPNFIVFQKDLNSDKKTLLPTEIKSFRVKNELYEAHTVQLETDLPDNAKETFPVDLQLGADTTIFLRCQAKGKWNLYRYIDKKGVSALYMNKGKDTLHLLKFRNVTEVQYGIPRIGRSEKYKRQLVRNFYDYPELFPKIQQTYYSIKSIQGIVEAYNEHFKDSSPVTYVVVRQKSKFSIGLLAGGNYSVLKIESAPTGFWATGLIPNQKPKGFGFNVGISTQLVLPRHNSRYTLTNDLILQTMRLSYSGAKTNETTQTNFDNMYLRLYSQVRLRLLRTEQFTFYVSAGVAPGYVLKTDNVSTITKSGSVSSRPLFGKGDFKAFNVSAIGGLSVELKNKLTFELLGEHNRGMSEYQTVRSRLPSLNARFKYSLR